MKKRKDFTKEELLADLIFMLEQSYIIEHKQDLEQMRKLCSKYGVSL